MAHDDDIESAVAALRSGGLVGVPTETVYGLGADAANADAVQRIFAAKGRPADNPLIVHVASADDIATWASEVPDAARQLAEAFWPGPLTIIVPAAASVASAVTAGHDTVALRCPDHAVALQLLQRFGGGIAAPSANVSGHVSPTTAQHVRDDLGDQVDVVLDGGPCGVGIESTIVDCTTHPPEVLRPGIVTPEDMSAVLGVTVVNHGDSATARPGSLPSHYAPRTPLHLCAADRVAGAALASRGEGRSVVVIASELAMPPNEDGITLLPLPDGNSERAAVLYARMREADAVGADVIICEQARASGIGAALNDRLLRAAHGTGTGSSTA